MLPCSACRLLTTSINQCCFTLSENEKKQQSAQDLGVTLELLGPKEETFWDDEGNIQITAGSRGEAAFFSNVDEELEQEWQELAQDTETQLVKGEMKSRDALQGVRVGSAGGWSLEVFPGDFVVHRYVERLMCERESAWFVLLNLITHIIQSIQ